MNAPTGSAAPMFTYDAEPAGEQGESNAVGFDLRHILAIVRGNLIPIGAIIALCLAAGVVSTLLVTPKYTAVASVQINQDADRVLDSDKELQPASSAQDADRFLKTQLDILQSRALSIRVAQALKLFGDPRFFQAMESPLPSATAGPAQRSVRERTIGLLQGHMDVTMPRESRIASISFHSTDPELAARVANAYATEFIRSNLQRKFDSSTYARSFLSDQLAEAKTRLEESERALNDYARGAGIVRTSPVSGSAEGGGGGAGGGSVTVASLVQLNAAANAARLNRIAAEQRYRALQSGPLMNARDVQANPTVQNLLSQKSTSTAALREERARHLPEHPRVIQLQDQVEEVERQLREAAQSVAAAVRTDYQAALAQERSVEQQVAAAKGDTLAEQDRSVQYNILAREADTNRTLYDGLLQRYKELTAAAGISASNVSVVDVAEAPLGPSSPKLFMNLIIALVAGVGLAALVVFVKEQLDDAVRVPEDVESKIGLPLLGVIPETTGGDMVAEIDVPRSSISEAYNALRGSLLYSTAKGLPKTILVTSSQASEGKSTTSYAIARGLARLGKKVLIIDTDLRRPSLHRLFDVLNDKGLTDFLTNHAEWNEVVRPSGFDNLQVMVSGPIPPSPTELLASSRMERLLTELGNAFDVVILDSPPVLGLADAPLLASLAEGTIFVVESDRGKRGATKAAVRRLKTAHSNLLGSVLTKFDGRKARNAYTYYYNYEYYQYGADRKGTPTPPAA